ncbi:MAG: hydrolase [Acidimicrobiia bacterium]|nr:MAG: hydrolase [Acidimicrobiia bacterium]
MQLVTFIADDRRRVGALLDDGVADLTAAGLPADMVELIESFDPAAVVDATDRAPRRALGEVRISAPLRPPKNVMAVGRNYRAHAQEFSRSGFDASEKETLPSHPVIFTKAATSVVGPEDPIVLSNDPTGTTDYEGELGVVIGRRCRRVTVEQARSVVFGWTIVNDVTARDLQKRHVQWFVGKSPDTFCPMGPAIVTVDELPDIEDRFLETRVNGEVRQRARIAELIFGIDVLISTLSEVITLEPGDVIATGTPEGVGIGFDPPRYLQPGDVVEVSIEGIGTLRNPVTP